MEKISISTEYIKLDQFLKWVGIVDSGTDAKFVIQSGEIKVNKEVELRRGRKLYPEDVVSFEGKEYKVTTL